MSIGSRLPRRVAYLGPPGTFCEEALVSEPDLAGVDAVAAPTISEALVMATSGEVDAALVPIENTIEGVVNVTLDTLIFSTDLFIQREVVIPVHLALLARSGTQLSDIARVISFPVATAQCRGYLTRHLPQAVVEATNSTADGARIVSEEHLSDVAAVAPALAAKLYGLEVLAHAIEDHEDNQTRFVLVAPGEIAAPTGHDRTTIVCFQHADRPGSLHEILGQFAARNLNLTRIQSRPTKQALGDYCFVIEVDGHVADEVLGDCLIELHAALGDLRVLGSYPIAGAAGEVARAEASAERRSAEAWLSALRLRVVG
jgi:prephenate dehydratase